ncbi:Tellurium resistance [Calidifontibacter sp. DB0510]|uniref:Tellurium resistance n=1 Tax=Metallococcus carri TaxID=1656884 RepID=A0A967AYM3_9MICO|nr:TerD domain-containing protein [Metallococcus carri]NHN55454.1 Tellurium resistance [Metallococcus carri]NOP38362.1 Tellurium resistance [Calidifontibacter sp. DB2511S]
MTELAKGANTTVPDSALKATLRWQPGPGVPDVDASALLLGADGKVASDADFVFYNQPRHTSGSVRHEGKTPGADALAVDLPAVPAEVERIVLAASADGGTFGQVPGLVLELATADGMPAATFPMTAEAETAFLCGELYRRGGGWKLRAVGQGYSSGLAGIATDFGISVEDEPEPAAPTPAPPAPAGVINLTKGASINLAKTAVIRATCTWPTKTDYDVLALVEYADGHVETVSQFGTTDAPDGWRPQTADGAVRHLGDIKRGGGEVATETIEIALNDSIRGVVPFVYSAQGNGLGSFKKYQVSMDIDNGSGGQVHISSVDANSSRFVYTCVPGIIINAGAEVRVQALELYSQKGSERRPTVTNGVVRMDAGPTNLYKK